MWNSLTDITIETVARLRDMKARYKALTAVFAGLISFISLSAIGQYILGSTACAVGKWADVIPDWMPNWACGIWEMLF